MAITGRTPAECFDAFLEHLGPMVRKMVPTTCPLQCRRPAQHLPQDRRVLSFSNPQHDDAIPIKCKHGTVFLYMAQELTAERNEDYRLKTVAYWYKIYDQSPTINDDAIVRWEYASALPGHSGPCRHHVQFGKMAQPISIGTGAFDLTRFHMPTGWVLMEEVFRFLVCELGMQPPCGEEWPEVLHKSERAFYDGFTDKGASGYAK